MLTSLYHPTLGAHVFKDEEVEDKTATGVWFKNPNEAKKMRNDYERQILSRPKQHKGKQPRAL